MMMVMVMVMVMVISSWTLLVWPPGGSNQYIPDKVWPPGIYWPDPGGRLMSGIYFEQNWIPRILGLWSCWQDPTVLHMRQIIAAQPPALTSICLFIKIGIWKKQRDYWWDLSLVWMCQYCEVDFAQKALSHGGSFLEFLGGETYGGWAREGLPTWSHVAEQQPGRCRGRQC